MNHLKPLKIEAHGHAPEEEKPVGKKKKKTEGNLKLESMVGKMMTEAQFDEAAGKKDACYHKVKARYDVWPSAYASGALVKCRKVGAANWGNKSKKEGVKENKDVVRFTQTFDTLLKKQTKGKAPTLKDLERVYGLMRKRYGELSNESQAYDIWAEDGSFGYTMTGIVEAEYGGRKVKLGKPMQGDVKKFKVYVKNPKGNVVKVNFGHGGSSAKGKTMKIRKSNPKARANFRARHNCDNPGPRHKARYWSCRAW